MRQGDRYGPDVRTPPTIGDLVSANVRRTRERRGLSVRQLSARLDELGYKLLPSGVTNVEARDPAKRRRVDVEDLVALALALKTTPAALLAGVEDYGQPVALTPERSVKPLVLEQWVAGAGYPAPYVERGDDRLVLDGSPLDVQRRHALDERGHPGRTAVQQLGAKVDQAVEILRDGVDMGATYVGTRPEDLRASVVSSIRRAAERVGTYLSLLVEELQEAERVQRGDPSYTLPEVPEPKITMTVTTAGEQGE